MGPLQLNPYCPGVRGGTYPQPRCTRNPGTRQRLCVRCMLSVVTYPRCCEAARCSRTQRPYLQHLISHRQPTPQPGAGRSRSGVPSTTLTKPPSCHSTHTAPATPPSCDGAPVVTHIQAWRPSAPRPSAVGVSAPAANNSRVLRQANGRKGWAHAAHRSPLGGQTSYLALSDVSPLSRIPGRGYIWSPGRSSQGSTSRDRPCG